jgi:hypothetical protein
VINVASWPGGIHGVAYGPPIKKRWLAVPWLKTPNTTSEEELLTLE